MAIFRRAKVLFKYSLTGTAVGVTCILLPPRETFTPFPLLFQTRVLLEGLGRVLRCAWVGMVILADYQWSLRLPGGAKATDQKLWDEVHVRSAKRLVKLAESNGGLYVKSGQVFASMSHLLPKAYTSTMAVLQDAVVKRPVSEIFAVLQEEFKQPVESLFCDFDVQPIAAASIAQVHRARLVSDGSEVAVKVQYVDIRARFQGDLRTIKFMLGVCGMVYPGYNFAPIVHRLDAAMESELNFVQEAKNAEQAGRELWPVFGTRVVCPEIRWNATTNRVLTTTFIHGVKISDREGIIRTLGSAQEVSKVARWCYQALSYQMFQTGFVHADPHAGNILVHKHPMTGKPQVVILDHGLYTTLTNVQREQLARIWTASVTHHSADLAHVARDLGIDDYQMLGSIFLQHPYSYFSNFKSNMSQEELKLIHTQAQDKMTEINQIIESLPKEYAFILRNITAVRAINKDLGNPVQRPLIMLQYSLPVSHDGRPWARWKCWLDFFVAEWQHELTTAFLTWWKPEVMKVVEDALAMA